MKQTLLLQSLAAHPEAEAMDALKFLYQNAFGCGHLLPEAALCARSIREELGQTQPEAGAPAFEPLGNGLCRLNLRAPMVRLLAPERIAAMMRETERLFVPSPQRYADNVLALLSLAEKKNSNLPFSAGELADSAKALEKTGGLPRHSKRYHAAYQPAYRVVLQRYAEALPLLAALEARLMQTGRALLVLDGDCASGKTTLAALLAQLYDANVLHMDDFFLPVSLRTGLRLAQPGGNVHHERFTAEVLTGLESGKPFTYGAYSCQTGKTQSISVAPKPVTIVEGSYALHPAFTASYRRLGAIRALLTVPEAEQERRILARNGPAMLTRFQNEWIPLEKRYFEAYHRNREDLLILQSHPLSEEALPADA